MAKIKKYAEEIPEEVKVAVASLCHPVRQAILVLLNKNKELSFSGIQKELGLDKVKLNFHLKNLFSAALIDHYYRHELGNKKYSYYSITPLGRRILNNLNNAFIPPVPFKQIPKQRIITEKYIPSLYDTSINETFHPSDKKQRPVFSITHLLVKTTASEQVPSSNIVQYAKAGVITYD